MLQFLVTQNVVVDAVNSQNETGLHYAAAAGDNSMVCCLLQSNANIHTKNIQNQTPLYLAVKNQHKEVVLTLLQHGATATQQINLLDSSEDIKRLIEDNYVRTIQRQFEQWLDAEGKWKRLKLMLVGDSGAGKTSVLRWLLGEEFVATRSLTDTAEITTADLRGWTRVTVDVKEFMADILSHPEEPNPAPVVVPPVIPQVVSPMETQLGGRDCSNVNTTDIKALCSYTLPLHALPIRKRKSEHKKHSIPSAVLSEKLLQSIDACKEKLQQGGLPMNFQIWDFGGQHIYANTHHCFFCNDAIYLLIVDISTGDEATHLKRLKYWLHTIRSYSAAAPIMLIGTHLDKVSPRYAQQLMTKLLIHAKTWIQNPPTSQQCITISCLEEDSNNRAIVRKALTDLAEQYAISCRLRWMLLFHALDQEAEKKFFGNSETG
mmetsp:Transcript_3878/g.5419  ORF Transcript_3878/g.5419 Transcript_3878/m.5419 type:complete len:432 (-) Transcript_3878:1302-2597(-)